MTIRVLVVASEWPTRQSPHIVPFLLRRVEALGRAGLHVDVEAFNGGGRPTHYLSARARVRARLSSVKYDIAHAHFGQAALTLLPSPVPMVVTFHGSDLRGIVGSRGGYTTKGRILSRLSRYVARRADGVILVAEGMAPYLPKGVSYSVNPMGVDLEVFSPSDAVEARRRLGLPTGKPLVLFAGRPDVPVKRHGLAARAVSLVGAELVWVSGQPPEVVADYMRACDVLLLTSRHEGSPVMVREALACSLPVVSVDVGDVKEVIGDLEGCVLCESDDPRTIATALAEAIGKRSDFDGRPHALRFEEGQLARRDIDVYRSVVERRRARS